MGLKYFSLGTDGNECSVFICSGYHRDKNLFKLKEGWHKNYLFKRSYASNLTLKMVHYSLSFLFC